MEKNLPANAEGVSMTLLANDLMDGPKQLTLLPDMEDALNKCLIVDEEFRLTEYDFPEVKVMVV